MTLQPSPRFSAPYSGHRGGCYRVFLRYLGCWFMVGSYVQYLLFGKFGLWKLDSLRRVPPIFSDAILRIVSGTSKKQMPAGGVNASRIIAMVQNLHSLRYRTNVGFVGYAMCSLLPTSIRHRHHAVSVAVTSSHPEPASAHGVQSGTLLNSFLKGFILRSRHVIPPVRVHVLRAVRSLTTPHGPLLFYQKTEVV